MPADPSEKARSKLLGRAYAEEAAGIVKQRMKSDAQSSAVGRAMSGDRTQSLFRNVAKGYLEAHDGDQEDTLHSLNQTWQGLQLKRLGLTEEHIRDANSA